MNRGNRAGGLKFLMPTSLPTSGQSQVLLQLHPLFSFFQALTLPIGVYATEADFANYQITSEPLKARIRLAAERAAPLFGVHPNNLLKIA